MAATLSEHVQIPAGATSDEALKAVEVALAAGLGRKKRRKAKWLLADAARIQSRLAPFQARATIHQVKNTLRRRVRV